MAFRIPQSTESLSIAEIDLFIRGYHVYQAHWILFTGLLLRREPENAMDKSAVAMIKDCDVVGHIPYNMCNIVSKFLLRDFNKAFTEVTGYYIEVLGTGLKSPVSTTFMDLNGTSANFKSCFLPSE